MKNKETVRQLTTLLDSTRYNVGAKVSFIGPSNERHLGIVTEADVYSTSHHVFDLDTGSLRRMAMSYLQEATEEEVALIEGVLTEARATLED